MRISWLFVSLGIPQKTRFDGQNGGNIQTKIWRRYKTFQKFTLLWVLQNLIFWKNTARVLRRVSLAGFIRSFRLSVWQKPQARLDIDSFQEIQASHWKPYLDNLHVCMTDATCYESHMRFPTDMKLLWESLEWLYRHICRHCRELGIRRPRNKYRNVAESYLSYCKKRKRRASRTRMLKRRMIKLLEKLLSQRDGIHSEYGPLLRYTQDYHKRLSIIRKVLVQEKEMFEGRKVSDRIVSIDRHYVRPIVRGKETKSVEFGAKVNNIQIDGISFIEHLSFKAFNEGIRLKDCTSRL